MNPYLLLVVLIGVASIFALGIGSMPIPTSEIIGAIIGSNVDEHISLIVWEVRLPRIIMAILIGMLLASSGAVVQSLFANPIADPYIIGIAPSATFGAVVAYMLKLPDIAYGILGFLSCVVVSFLIFRISKMGGIATLLIVGIALSSFLGAFTSFATYLIGEESFKIVAWLMGYLGGASWQKVGILCVPVVLTLGYFYWKRFELDLLLLGDDEAKSLGVNVERLKKHLLVATSLSVGFSVAFTGLIGFVGLIIPHLIRMLLRNSSNILLLPLSALFGGLFVLLCDSMGRIILDPIEIPIGVISAFFGAPFFLYLAMQMKNKRQI